MTMIKWPQAIDSCFALLTCMHKETQGWGTTQQQGGEGEGVL